MEMLTCIGSQRQRNAAEYALKVIQSSCIKPYIKTIYLYGSCARGEEKNTAATLICFWNCQNHFFPDRNLKSISIC